MRNLEKGQHIFIAFQNGKAVLDSQLRPRIYTSLENADKWTPTVNKGKIEYVEYAPTLTPANEWVKMMEAINNAAVAYIEGGPYENDLPGMEFALKIDRLSRDFVRPPEGEEEMKDVHMG